MKRFYSLILLCVTAVGSFLLCTKNPFSTTPDDMRDELKPPGSISGFVYDKKGNPLKDVLIDVDSGKGTPDITEANGYFTISEVIDSCVLRFIHRDYEDNPVKVYIKTGLDTILRDTICLTCFWYTIKGVVKSSNGVQIGSGVAISGHITSTLTGIGETFVLKQIPESDTVTLICSKAGAGAAIIPINNSKDNDTTDAGEILLNDKESATVSGIVYSKNNIPLSGVTVSAVGGGTHAITDVNGYYKLQDIPVGTDCIIIKAGQTNVEGMIGGIKASNSGNSTGCNIVMSEMTEMTYGMKLHTKNV
ncbi:MAG: hypothetical protein JW915_15065 [Chitinispirillaceae bacterium]|nr:hypothetical protein [Chitinispirillaceae bacterium]